MAPVEKAPVPITVAHGDGIGPEIMPAALEVLQAAGARLEIDTIVVGEKMFETGEKTGINQADWDSIKRTGIIFKAPITTPRGGGFKSLNVTIRKTVGLFANVRPCISYAPFVATKHPVMDCVIVRENEEDLYAGIEHRQTDEFYQGLKLVTRAGTERIIRYAFDYARANGRKKVTALVKDNIMKFTDGLFKTIFYEVAKEYPDLTADDYIVDIGMARVANRPESFDVIVTQNLYGDIVSDIAAEITGSIGLGASSNIGETTAMFEAIHGSAPDIAGKGIANPSGLILAGVMMLNHIGQGDVATKVHNAWLKTIEDGIHTGEIWSAEHSTEKAGTRRFTDAVIERLGQKPLRFKPVDYSNATEAQKAPVVRTLPPCDKQLVGSDIFIGERGVTNADALGDRIAAFSNDMLKLKAVSSKGVKIYPNAPVVGTLSDAFSCRFMGKGDGASVTHAEIIDLLRRMTEAGFDVIKIENLYTFDGKPGFTLGAGE